MNDLSTSSPPTPEQILRDSAEGQKPSSAVETDSASPESHNQASYQWRWSLFLAVCLLLVLAGNWLLPRIAIFFDTVGNFQWQIVFLLVCLTVYQAIRKRWAWMLIILVLVVLPALNLMSFYLPARQPPPGPQKISILSMNVFKNNQSWEKVAELIREVDADVVQLIEFTPECNEAIGAVLDRYPHQQGRESYGIATVSKIPIQRDEFMSHAFDPWVEPGIGTKLEVGGQKVFLLGVHPPSPTSPLRWATRDDRIKDLMEACWFRRQYMHVVVIGDLNATSHCHSVDWLLGNSGMRDTRYGFGLQNSWPAPWWPFMICIDHVFVSDLVHVHQRSTQRYVGSDHLPVLVELSFARHPMTRD